MTILEEICLIIFLWFIFGIIEKKHPLEPHQPNAARRRNMLLAIGYVVIGGGMTIALFKMISWKIEARMAYGWSERGVRVLAAIAMWDVLFYVYHRAQHRYAWLWNIHRLHHADAHLNATSALRHAWIENPIQGLLLSFPVVFLLQLDAIGVALFGGITLTWLVFIHANVRCSLRALTPYLGGPQLHRIHHSLLDKHRDKNFAVYFPGIDRLFGTYYAPQKEEFPPTGTREMPSYVSWKEAVLGPFTAWRKKQSFDA